MKFFLKHRLSINLLNSLININKADNNLFKDLTIIKILIILQFNIAFIENFKNEKKNFLIKTKFSKYIENIIKNIFLM
jgi:hypothetical protein